MVGDVFTNLDGSCNIGIWQVTAVSGTAVTIKLLFCNKTVSNINSTLKNVENALNTIAPIKNDPTKTVINGGKIDTGTITANSIATNAITSAKIIASAVTTSKIAANAIIADKIAANAVTADKISVKTLSAINANLGTITAGSLSAVSINNGKGTFRVDANGNMTAKSASITGTIQSNNPNTLFSIEMNDGYLKINGTKNSKSIKIGEIGGYKPINEQTSNYDTMTIACKYGDGISFDFYSSTDNVYHPKYIINNGRNPDNYIESHIWYGSERHNSLAIFRDLIIDRSNKGTMTLFSSQNSKSLTFSTGTIDAKDSWSTNGQSYIINNGENPNGITNRHIWYGSEYHGGIAQFGNYVDIFGSALRFYTTQGSVHPDNGRNFVGQIFGGYSTKGIYNLNIGGDVGDALILSIKEGNSNGSYVTYIAMKEQGLKQKIEFEQPTYIYDLHLGKSAAIDSDRRLKKDITSLNINKSSEFIYSLNPVSYKYKENNSDRFHHGLIAQELKQSMGNDDWGVYIDNSFNKSSSYPMLGICYEELIADIIATLQSQNNRINFLEKQIPQLQNQILQLQNQLNNINGGK